MSHIRTAVRAALAGLYAGDIGASGFRTVNADPVFPKDRAAHLPALDVIFVSEESPSRHLTGGGLRVMTLRLEVIAEGSGLQDRLDALGLIVEQRLGADPTLGGLARRAGLTGVEQSLAEGEKRTGLLQHTVTVWVAADEADPQS